MPFGDETVNGENKSYSSQLSSLNRRNNLVIGSTLLSRESCSQPLRNTEFQPPLKHKPKKKFTDRLRVVFKARHGGTVTSTTNCETETGENANGQDTAHQNITTMNKHNDVNASNAHNSTRTGDNSRNDECVSVTTLPNNRPGYDNPVMSNNI